MGERMVVVHAAPLWEIQLLQGRLEQEGIPTFIPDQSTKLVDPFITGGSALTVSLCVPEDHAQTAMELVGSYQEEGREPPEELTEAELLAQLGARVRWASLLLLTAPLALWWGVQYLWRLRTGVERPREHWFTIVAIVFSLLLVVLLIALVDPFNWHFTGRQDRP